MMTPIAAVKSWFEKRLGLSSLVGPLMHKPLSGGARYQFSLGSLNLLLFVNQMLTGIFLMIYYVNSPDHAYDAVKYIQSQVDFGYLVRGLHYWGASALVVSVLLHVVRVFIYGAYKKPREIMWVSGTFLALLVFGFAFTGYLLPWDQKSYWATVVGTSIPGTIPVVGDVIVRLLRGGTGVNNLTLARFFSIHVEVLPWLLAIFAGTHLVVLQIVDHAPPWNPEKAKIEAPFYPDQVFKDMVLFLLAFAALVALSNLYPAPLGSVADPTVKTYVPRPEWYFLFLYQMLKLFPGPYEIIGTTILPSLFIILMLLLPFYDRNSALAPKKRPLAMACIGTCVIGYIALTSMAAFSGVTSGGPSTVSVSKGKVLFAKLHCDSCHSINGVGGQVGPPLDKEADKRTREWLIAHFKDPAKMSPGSIMPKFNYLTKEQLNELTDYMQSLK
ncbi:MAG: cytochrome b N-terminal domain-containing protein [Nitrospirota bacterium]